MSAELEGQTLTERWLEHLAEGRELSPRTVKSYADALADFCRRMDITEPEKATLAVLDRYRFRLRNAGLALATRRIRLQGVKSFFRFLKSRGLIEEDPTLNFEIPSAKSFAAIPTFKGWEIEKLVAHYPPLVVKGRQEPGDFYARRKANIEFVEARDPALLSLVYACGLRRSEPGLLEREDYDGRYLHIRGGKSAKTVQTVEVMKRARLEMALYLDFRDASSLANHPALFPPVTEMPDRSRCGPGISPWALCLVLARRIERAGIDPKRRRLSPHTLRYSIATHLYECGYHPLDIARHLRHAGMQTLARYVSLSTGLPKLRTQKPHPWMLGRSFLNEPSED